MVDLRYATARELASEAELVQIREIQAQSSEEIDALACPDDDVVGDRRVCRFLRATQGDVQQVWTSI